MASGAFEESHVYATARAKEQVDAISAAGINACQLELTDEQAVNDLILKNESTSKHGKCIGCDARETDDVLLVQLVIHTATSIDPKPAALLIAALAELKKSTAKKTYFVHVSHVVRWSYLPMITSSRLPATVRSARLQAGQRERLKTLAQFLRWRRN